MAALASWYNNPYSVWNRTRRMHAPTFLARVDTNASRNAVAQRNGNDVVINMGDVVAPANTHGSNDKKEAKDTLFGPSIGVVGGGPEWCEKDGKDKEVEDELTPDVVKEWVRRSKEPTEPTTTLQALVNLKRPTIRLSPLASSLDPSASSDSQVNHQQQQHGLEFEFDCDAPKCQISLHVVGVPAHFAEDHPTNDSSAGLAAKDPIDESLHLFEMNVDGGFGRKLHLSEGAVLELAKLEHAEQQAKLAAQATTPSDASTRAEAAHAHAKDHSRKRLTFFKKKGHSTGSQLHPGAATPPAAVTAGPALAVVDAEMHPTPPAQPQPESTTAAGGTTRDAEKERKKLEEEGGVKVTIRLTALDADGRPLRVRNEQVTYLHIVRLGAPPAPALPAEGEAAVADSQTQTQPEAAEDTRPWVVRVVKREARIGPHAFHLHEIYGLTSHAAAPAHPLAPTAPTPEAAAPAHTYPPTADGTVAAAGTGTVAAQAHEDPDPTAECLLCLSSPREVVLLPCRHLVACRECAVNMVEFGAGGTLVHTESEQPTTPAAGTTAAAEGEAATAEGANATTNGNTNATEGAGAPSNPPAATAAPLLASTTRRKRKAKGWFCPVCRQPYTSLLRITTTPPPSKHVEHSDSEGGGADGKRVSVASSLEPHDSPLADPSAPTAAAAGGEAGADGMESRGPFASLSRPGFLRHFSRVNAIGTTGTSATQPDLERGQVSAAA